MTRRRQSGFSLLEAMMASVLLTAAAAGVLLPIVAAANAQTDAQSRVIATRLAADVIETLIARGYQDLDNLASPAEITPADLGYTGPAYEHIKAVATTESVSVGQPGSEFPMLLLTVEVFDNNKPMATLKTLLGSQ